MPVKNMKAQFMPPDKNGKLIFSALQAALNAVLLMSCITALIAPQDAFSAEGTEIRAASSAGEEYERDVDTVARASQEQAIARLSSLLRKYKNTSQEPVLLAKLADLQQQDASILFRIAHGKANKSKKAIDLTHFKKSMNEAIITLNVLIQKYPSFAEIAHAYFMRGKGQEELENKVAAAKDYNYLVNRFPLSDEASSAYMSLADFAIDANDHPKAISYLKEVEKKPEDSHYPFALYKLAWSYYNLKDIPTALHYAETQIHYYDQQKDQSSSENNSPLLANSDNALRENTLLDSTVFYFEGYEENPSKYSPSDAIAYFRKLEKGPVYGRMLLRYAKLLRSHAHDADLITWKNLALKEEAPETLDVVIVAYEHLQNRRNYPELTKTAEDIVALYNRSKHSKAGMYESMPKAQKMLLDTAEAMQSLIVKNKDAQEAKALSTTLASIYFAFVGIVDEADVRIPGVHYNLAETLFAIKDYENATLHYRWVVEHGNWKKKDKQAVSIADSSLKAIASRYEVLQKEGLIPKDVTPVSIAKDSQAPLQAHLKEWIDWIDEHLRHSPNQEGTDNFVFEANRSLYHDGHIVEGLQRLSAFAEDHPKSTYAIPSVALVIDTYIATGDWNILLKKSEELREVPEWKNTPFNQRLFSVSADASYKLIEEKAKQKNYPDTLAGIDRFLKTYSKSERLGDALVLAGTASMESHQDQLAMKYFSRLIHDLPNSKAVKDALMARAQLEESSYLLMNAAMDYQAYLKYGERSDATKDGALQKKILALMWISGDWAALKSALAEKDLCNSDTETECGRYAALGALTKPELFGSDIDAAFDKARKMSGELAGLWAIVSLQQAKELAFRDRLLAIRHTSQHWDELDPLVKLSVLPYLNSSIPNALAMNRKMMNEVAPLRGDAKYITHRVDVMREMENAVTLAMKLPWARIKAGAMNELASTYLDFSSALSNLQPKGLEGKDLEAYQDTVRKIVVPFEEKGQDIRAKAFQMGSDYAIENTDLNLISGPFFTDNPSQAKKFRKPAVATTAGTLNLDLDFMEIADTSMGWKKIDANLSTEPSNSETSAANQNVILAREFLLSLREQNWPKLAYLLQKAEGAKNSASFKATTLITMRAVSMVALGAQAEGLMELEQSRAQWEGQSKVFILGTLAQYFQHSYALERAQSYQKEIEIELAPKAEPKKS
jgi:TolA-binding protein